MVFRNLNYWTMCETPPNVVKRAKKAMQTMEIVALDNPVGGHTHMGVVYVDGFMLKYLGRMEGDVFQFDPTTRCVSQWR